MAKDAIDVGLVSANPEAILDFYTGVFGFQPLDPLVIPGAMTVHKLACGASVLRVLESAREPKEPDADDFAGRIGIRYLTLEVTDIHAVAEAVVAHGGSMLFDPLELRPGRLVSQATDPDGNVIEIGQGDA